MTSPLLLSWSVVEPVCKPGLKMPFVRPHTTVLILQDTSQGAEGLKMRRASLQESQGLREKSKSMLTGFDGTKFPLAKKIRRIKHSSLKYLEPYLLSKYYIKLFLANSLSILAHEIQLYFSSYIIFSIIGREKHSLNPLS